MEKYTIARIIAAIISVSCAFLFYQLMQRDIRHGNYSFSRWGRNKETLWDFPFYIAFIASVFFVAVLLGFID